MRIETGSPAPGAKRGSALLALLREQTKRVLDRLFPKLVLYARNLTSDRGKYRLRDRIRSSQKGFVTRDLLIYEHCHGRADDCLTDIEGARAARTNGKEWIVLRNKLLFHYMAAGAGAPLAELCAYKADGTVTEFGDALQRRLSAGAMMIAKPVMGTAGRGVVVIRDRGDLDRLREDRGSFVIHEYVRQADYSARIHGPSTNTMRLMTMWPRGDPAPAVTAAVHRFGSARTRDVDGFDAGGLVAAIDLESGRLGRAASAADGGTAAFHEAHPDTGARIADVVVPDWANVMDLVARLAASLPFLPYIGWDVVLTDDGPVIIEGNGHPLVTFVQIHTPLKRNAQAVRFYKSYGIF